MNTNPHEWAEGSSALISSVQNHHSVTFQKNFRSRHQLRLHWCLFVSIGGCTESLRLSVVNLSVVNLCACIVSAVQSNAEIAVGRRANSCHTARMASVVFFRAVNVGGHQKFQPGVLAKALAEFGVVNIGAAGTFVVRENVSPARLRDEMLRRLPFRPELMICPARDVLALARGKWFEDEPAGKDVGRFASVLQKAPRAKPPLPIEQPAGGKWEVRIIAITGRFVLSVRRLGQTYSNAVVEKHFGVPATTRNWNTIETIREILETGK